MRLFLPILFAVPMLASAGCATVVLTEPFGQPIAREEAMKLQGVWLTPDGEVATVKHVHENKLQIAGVDWKNGKFELVEFTVFVTSEEDRQYVNILDPESRPMRQWYGLARLIVTPENERDNYYILIYLPNPEPFEKAIEAGQLSGTVKKEKFSTIVKLVAPLGLNQANPHRMFFREATKKLEIPACLLRIVGSANCQRGKQERNFE